MEYRELAEKSGIVHWRRVPALNTDERFIADMADMVIEALESPALSVSEAASQNAEFLVEKTAVASQLGLTMQGTHMPPSYLILSYLILSFISTYKIFSKYNLLIIIMPHLFYQIKFH